MSTNLLDTFTVLFDADVAGLIRGFADAMDAAKKTANEVDAAGEAAAESTDQAAKSTAAMAENTAKAAAKTEEMGKKLKELVKGAAGLFGLGLSIHAVSDKIQEMAESYDKLDKMAARFRTTTDAVDEFLDVSGVLGVKESAAVEGLTALDRAIGDTALGLGRAKAVFEEIGVKALDAHGKMRPVTAVMDDLAAKMKGMERGKAIRVMERLGLDPALMKVFNADLGTISARLAAIDKATGFDLDTTVKRSKDFMSAMKGLKMEFEYIQTFLDKMFESFASDALPLATQAIKNVTNAIRTVTEYLMQHQHFLKAVFAEMGIAIAVYLLPAMWSAAAAAIAMLSPFLLVGAAIAVLALAIDDVMTFMEGGDSIIGRWAQKWPILGDIVRALVAQIRQFGDIAMAVMKLLVGIFENPAKAWNTFVEDIVASEQRFQDGAAGIAQAFAAMGDSVTAVWSDIVAEVRAAIATVTGAIDTVVGTYEKAKSAVSGVMDSIKSGIDATVDVFGGQPAIAGGAMIAAANTAPVNGISSSAISNSRTSSKTVDASVKGPINVYTQATDADGISKSIGDSLGAQMRQAADHHDDGIAY